MLRYGPGEWYAIVTPGACAMLAPDVPSEVLDSVWSSLSAGNGFAAVVEGLVGAFGASLSSLPAFAVASLDADTGEVRVVARGAMFADIELEDGVAEQVSGLGVTTWSEKVVPAVSVLTLRGLGDSAPTLPIRDGVVRADVVRWVIGRAAALPSAASAPVVSLTDAVASTSEPAVPVPAASAADSTAGLQVVLPADGSHENAADAGEPTVSEAVSLETVFPELESTLYAKDDEDEVGDDAVGEHTTAYDDLIFGETRMSTVEDAAIRDTLDPDHAQTSAAASPPAAPAPPVASVRAALPPPPAPQAGVSSLISGIPSTVVPSRAPTIELPVRAPGGDQLGDHDGETMSAEQLAALQAQLPREVEPTAAHAATRPAATMLVSTGERVVLDRSAVVGRRPRAVRATGVVPHLVAVASPNQDISRSHVELRVEGSDVVAVDLGTTNGTRLLRVGAEPVRLHPNEIALLVSGDRLDLGDSIVLSFEGL